MTSLASSSTGQPPGVWGVVEVIGGAPRVHKCSKDTVIVGNAAWADVHIEDPGMNQVHCVLRHSSVGVGVANCSGAPLWVEQAGQEAVVVEPKQSIGLQGQCKIILCRRMKVNMDIALSCQIVAKQEESSAQPPTVDSVKSALELVKSQIVCMICQSSTLESQPLPATTLSAPPA